MYNIQIVQSGNILRNTLCFCQFKNKVELKQLHLENIYYLCGDRKNM